MSLSRLDPGWGPDSDYRQQVPTTADIKPWKLLYYTFPAQAIAPHLSNFSITERYADWFPDISGTHLGLIVTEDVRAVIEDLDADGNYFFPMQIRITETGDPRPGNRFYWKPRREMVFTTWSPKPDANPEHHSGFPPGSSFGNRQVAWQFTFNERLRDFLSQVPFWTYGPDHYSFAMSPTVFRRLKSERFTGLLEFTSDDYNSPDFDHSHNVGFF